MPDLILNSLEIQNFRGLRELRIERLGRVNLLVGKNNVGKTSVLEALHLYANPASPEVYHDILTSRDQIDQNIKYDDLSGRKLLRAFRSLFFDEGGTITAPTPAASIHIGENGLAGESLSIALEVVQDPSNLFNQLGYHLVFSNGSIQRRFPLSWLDLAHGIRSRDNPASIDLSLDGKPLPCSHVGANGLFAFQTGALWNRIQLTRLEDDVTEAMRLLVQDVERLAMMPIDENSRKNVPFIKLKGATGPIPLRGLGDGMNRIFGIALALVNAKEGFLLVDEIENGLHYSILADVWSLVFDLATRLNVQIFATTHSYDCIKGFGIAARESDEEGLVIRIAQKAGQMLVGEFDEKDIGIAVKGQIEVR